MNRILIIIALLTGSTLSAQNYAKDWHLKFSKQDTSLGIDLENAIKNNPKPSNSATVIVAVIDDGIDIQHEDLKTNIWVNKKEIPGNAVDDDLNGYIDDINGWDFIGGSDKDVEYDNLELTRLLRDYQKKFGNKTKKEISKSERTEFAKFKELEKIHTKKYTETESYYNIYKNIKSYLDALKTELGTTEVSVEKLEKFEPSKNEAKIGRNIVLGRATKENIAPSKIFKEFEDIHDYFYAMYQYHLNLKYDPRYIIGDDYTNTANKSYGNNEVKGPDGEHGSHVGGIIGAIRNNNIGMNGVASDVQIMVIRVVPNGDERDKDVANAIRYAVDNGAKVINMSFGKGYSFNKTIVDEAVKYAESKDVLMIHAAGNDSKNIDKESNYPTPFYADGKRCSTWIEVGASDKDQQPAEFSNFGAKTVNVFAPGVEIYSTVPDNKYEALSGTSMASPVTAGLAALIRSYYPNLTAAQVKSVIENSSVKPTQKVKIPGTKKKTKYKKLCTTGGIINADSALKAAATIK